MFRLLQVTSMLGLLIGAQAFGLTKLNRALKRDNSVCDGVELDVIFVLDESGSVDTPEFAMVKDFVKNTVDGLNIDNGDVRAGLLTFYTQATVEANLNQFTTNVAFKAEVDSVVKNTGGSRFYTAVTELNAMLMTARSGVRQAVVVLSDGAWSYKMQTSLQIDALKTAYPAVEIFSVWQNPECVPAGQPNSSPALNDLVTDADNKLCVDLSSQAAAVSALLDGLCDIPCAPACANEGTCVAGECDCTPQYTGDSCQTRIDPCNPPPCDTNAVCSDNEDGTPKCDCNDGYMGNGFTCELIDACNSDPCDNNADCSNAEDGTAECECRDGWQGEGFSCSDIDECNGFDGAPSSCGPNTLCINCPGTFECFCDPGYMGNPPTTPCTLINACDSDPCPANSACSSQANSEGFMCTCNTGFENPGEGSCTDINECGVSVACLPNEECVNTIGSAECVCRPFYGLSPCVLLNPCMGVPNPCDLMTEVCVPTDPAAFRCDCAMGFSGEPCADINECADDTDNCLSNEICVNTIGSFYCYCPEGFGGATCEDINECDSQCKDSNSNCDNNIGSFLCECVDRFTGDPFAGCTAINFCGDPQICDENAFCDIINNCVCKIGYKGDGETCSAPCPAGK